MQKVSVYGLGRFKKISTGKFESVFRSMRSEMLRIANRDSEAVVTMPLVPALNTGPSCKALISATKFE